MSDYAKLRELVSHRVTFDYDTGAKIVGGSAVGGAVVGGLMGGGKGALIGGAVGAGGGAIANKVRVDKGVKAREQHPQ